MFGFMRQWDEYMVHFFTQMSYLRDVQRTFQTGANRIDLIGIFSKIFSVAVPLLLLLLLWHYRYQIGSFAFRFFSHLFFRRHQVVEEHLVSRKVLIGIYQYTSKGVGRKIADARIATISNGKMVLKLVRVEPTGLMLRNTRVVCFTKPFNYKGEKLNAFMTYISTLTKKGMVIKEVSLSTPFRYQFIVRRKHSRLRIAREGAVRVKIWNVRKRTFWVSRPDLRTIDNPALQSDKMRLTVENISAGGMRLMVLNPSTDLPFLRKGNEIIMRISVWSPHTRKFAYFEVIGTVRSRFKGKGSSLGLGIQFTAEGEKIGNKYAWKTLPGEVKVLADYLEKNAT